MDKIQADIEESGQKRVQSEQDPKQIKSFMNIIPSRRNKTKAESRVDKINNGHNPTWKECHVARLLSGQIPCTQTPR